MSIFVNNAFAQEAANAAAKQPSVWASLAPLGLIMVVFYFLLIRPQQKKMKDHQNMILSLNKGTEVVTSGGIIGVVTKIDEANNSIEIEIADKVQIKVRRDMITEVIQPKNA